MRAHRGKVGPHARTRDPVPIHGSSSDERGDAGTRPHGSLAGRLRIPGVVSSHTGHTSGQRAPSVLHADMSPSARAKHRDARARTTSGRLHPARSTDVCAASRATRASGSPTPATWRFTAEPSSASRSHPKRLTASARIIVGVAAPPRDTGSAAAQQHTGPRRSSRTVHRSQEATRCAQETRPWSPRVSEAPSHEATQKHLSAGACMSLIAVNHGHTDRGCLAWTEEAG